MTSLQDLLVAHGEEIEVAGVGEVEPDSIVRGFGGAVTEDGRYGWIGGTGTTAHVEPSTVTVAVLLTQVQMAGPTPTPLMREFWQYAFGGRASRPRPSRATTPGPRVRPARPG